MLPVSQDERDQLIAAFWEAVRSRLIRHHHRSAEEADRGIGQYRHAMDSRQVGDVLYNQGVERTAEAVNGVLEYGLPQLPRSRRGA